MIMIKFNLPLPWPYSGKKFKYPFSFLGGSWLESSSAITTEKNN